MEMEESLGSSERLDEELQASPDWMLSLLRVLMRDVVDKYRCLLN